MANTFEVADFFVRLANQSADDYITNLKLNKLMYYAQGAFLARTGEPLFPDHVQAWQFGPVVPAIYHKYKVCGANPIVSDEASEHTRFPEDELEVLLDVMREFGQYTGSKLVSLTHAAGTPWSNAREKGTDVLEASEMKQYFTDHPVPRFADKITVPQVEALPADWYDPEEDTEWEAYL